MKFGDVYADRIHLLWEPPTADGGSPITNYIVDKRETSRANWALVTAKISGKTTECTVEKLIEGHEYQFRIRAENKYGVGDPILSSPVDAKNPFGKIYSYLSEIVFIIIRQTITEMYGLFRCSWTLRSPCYH